MTRQEVLAPVVAGTDIVIALTTGTIRAGLRAAGVVAGGLRPVLGPALRPADWPYPMRVLAETGSRRRSRVVTGTIGLARKAVPAVVTAVLDEIDLAGIVREVVYEIDLPEIIRASTGSVAGEMVREARIRVMAADDTVSRWSGRVFTPHRAPATGGPG